ncbi:MAG: TetR/AcrR family transcriptional regulator [Thermodesulfobacteriota bacterium]
MNRRKATESKKIILEAASEVFAERGYSGTTIREVARRAGISIGGIYIYFQNKEELYLELTRDQMETFRKHTEMLRDKEALAALKALIEYHLDYAIKNTALISMHIKEYDLEFKKNLKKTFFDSQERLVTDILKKGVMEGIFKDINCEETAEVILFSLRGATMDYLFGQVSDLKKYGQTLYQLILNGIRREAA